MSAFLSREDFLSVVNHAPLVSIDLIVSNAAGEVLLGERVNAPAQGFWFVPGGRILKNEALRSAFARITQAELGQAFAFEDAVWHGAWDHFYDDNFAGAAGIGTHYVVLAFRLDLGGRELQLPDAQHSRYRWQAPASAVADASVHLNTRAYF
jgi:colanic acid biosynthesis protein WcaH